MKRLCFLVICMSIIMGCSTSTSSTKALVDYVDPNIGTAHCRWFFYTPAAIPFGMAKLAPSTDAHLEIPVVGKQWGMIFVILPSKALPIFTSSR